MKDISNEPNEPFFLAHLERMRRGALISQAVLFFDEPIGRALVENVTAYRAADRAYQARRAEIDDAAAHQRLYMQIVAPTRRALNLTVRDAYTVILPRLLNGTLRASALHDGTLREIHPDEWRSCQSDPLELFLKNSADFSFGRAVQIQARPLHEVSVRAAVLALCQERLLRTALLGADSNRSALAQGMAVELVDHLIRTDGLLLDGDLDAVSGTVIFPPDLDVQIPALVAVVNEVRVRDVTAALNAEPEEANIPPPKKTRSEAAEEKCRQYFRDRVPPADRAARGETTKQAMLEGARRHCGSSLTGASFELVWSEFVHDGHPWRERGRRRKGVNKPANQTKK